MMDARQLTHLTRWLSACLDHPDVPKFIFASSVIAPVRRSALYSTPGRVLWTREDGFAGHPEELTALVSHIVTNQIQNVVFVGGDMHLSCTAEMRFRMQGYPDVNVLQLVASGLHAPFDFANSNPADFDWRRNTTIPLKEGCAIEYAPTLLVPNGGGSRRGCVPPHFLHVRSREAGGRMRRRTRTRAASGQPQHEHDVAGRHHDALTSVELERDRVGAGRGPRLHVP
jgi:hypothetical protein